MYVVGIHFSYFFMSHVSTHNEYPQHVFSEKKKKLDVVHKMPHHLAYFFNPSPTQGHDPGAMVPYIKRSWFMPHSCKKK